MRLRRQPAQHAAPVIAARPARMARLALLASLLLPLMALPRTTRAAADTVSSPATSAASATTHSDMHPPATLAEWAQGAQLFTGLGDFHRAIHTSSPEAQQYFDQGMRLLWAFNHDEATRSFAQAARLDADCAACWWGLALTVGPNYNNRTFTAARAQVAWDALQKAQASAARAAAVEQALIGALAARYPAPQPPGPGQLATALGAYAAAMREVAARFPDDLDVQTLCAEAEMSLDPWKLWGADGLPGPGTRELAARLEAVLAREPRHPGANHYYIHVMEASPHPAVALAAAERLRGLMPAAGHLEHMPAHIFENVGRYEDAAEANRRAVRADEAYLTAASAPDYYPMYLAHNYAFLAYAAAMEGRKAETLAAVQGVIAAAPLEMRLAMGDSGWGLTQQYAALVRFGLWDELIALQPPTGSAPGLTAGYLYGRGVALAARGRLAEAQRALEALTALARALPEERRTLRAVLAVAEPIVAARIAASGLQGEQAIVLLTRAVAAEDQLAYAEPATWFFPARHLLGAQLLIAGRSSEAEQVYRTDLARNPNNGWSLYGLAAALRGAGQSRAALHAQREFERAWQHADVRLPGSAFWFAGPDTTSCECQRQP